MTKGRPGTALGALHSDTAPGAELNGEVSGWAELAQAARAHGRKEAHPVAERLLKLQNAMSERVPSSGGFVVPEVMRSDMVYASLEAAIIRPLATVIPASTLRVGLPAIDDTTHASGAVLGGMAWNWTEEGALITSSAPSYQRIVLEAKKLVAYLGGVPDELLDDGPAFNAFCRRVIPQGLAWAEDNAFIQGSGVGQPQGILSAPCAIPVTRQAASKVGMTDILSMLTRILPQSMRDFIWLCSPDVLQQILQAFFAAPPVAVVNVTLAATTVAAANPNPYPVQVTVAGGTVTAIAVNGVTTNATSGTYTLGVGAFIAVTYSVAPTLTTTALSTATGGVVPPPTWLMGSPTDGWTLLGRPIVATEHCPALGTKGDLVAVDPRFYVIMDRLAMEIATSAVGAKYVQDETEFRIISRLDGRIWFQQAITPENGSATVSPVVILN